DLASGGDADGGGLMVEYRPGAGVPQRATAGSLWQAMSGRPLSADLLDWPPDLFALTSLVLQRSGALSGASYWPLSSSAKAGAGTKKSTGLHDHSLSDCRAAAQ